MKNSKCKMDGRTHFSFFILPFALALLASCTSVAPREEAPLKQATVEALTALLSQREVAIQTMKGLFSAKVRGGLITIASRMEGG